MITPLQIVVTDEHELTSAQKTEFLQLALCCFPDVTAGEAEEDFCCEPVARVLAANTRGSDGTLSPDLRCATRDANGRWAMVYTTIGCPVRVVMSRLAAGEARAFWYNPRNGLWHVEGREGDKRPFTTGLASGPGTADRHFYAPGSTPGPGRTYREYPEGNDWVLVLEVGQDG